MELKRFKFKNLLLAFLAGISFSALSAEAAAPQCRALVARLSERPVLTTTAAKPKEANKSSRDEQRAQERRLSEIIRAELPKSERTESVRALLKFAEKYELAFKWLELGPEDRKIKRLFVAIDISRPEVLKAYRDTFNLDTEVNKGSFTLPLEFVRESLTSPEHYVPAIMRRWADPMKPGYRWGKPDPYIETYQKYFEDWMLTLPNRRSPDLEATGIAAFAHLIEVNAAEKTNIEYFLDHPEERGKCKSDNCVAWQTGIELGVTKPDATDAERKYLFSELGISRTMAHFEIARRLMHAANERHNAIGVFVNGELGLKTFNEKLEKTLIPDPKVPYGSILKNYVSTIRPALKAVEAIPDGAKVFMPIAAGASPDAVAALVDRAAGMQKGIDLHVLVNGISATEFRRGVETTDGKFRVHALFLGGNMRELYADGKIAVVPGNLSDFTKMVADPAQVAFHYDAIVVRVSPPDEKGFHSLGPNNDMIMTILKLRPDIKIIAEVNKNVPYTNGENKIHGDRFTAKFESNTELAGPAVVPPSEVDAKIGANIGKLISSGATLQIGIGNIFSGVADGLQAYGVKDLKISTEMFGDAMMDIMDRGIATKAETGFAYGSKKLYNWLNHNWKVEFKETEEVNAPGRVAEVPQFHAVNTALQVNLYGETNATMGPNGRISSPGGQVEFMTGAARSAGGKAIIAIRSTAKEGALSTIVLDLYRGPITTPHESVTHVVTEYGIAELRGKSEPERALALINVAHPKFREQLFNDAVAAHLLTENQRSRIQTAPPVEMEPVAPQVQIGQVQVGQLQLGADVIPPQNFVEVQP
jgi:acyl-CoA hydrolase